MDIKRLNEAMLLMLETPNSTVSSADKKFMSDIIQNIDGILNQLIETDTTGNLRSHFLAQIRTWLKTNILSAINKTQKRPVRPMTPQQELVQTEDAIRVRCILEEINNPNITYQLLTNLLVELYSLHILLAKYDLDLADRLESELIYYVYKINGEASSQPLQSIREISKIARQRVIAARTQPRYMEEVPVTEGVQGQMDAFVRGAGRGMSYFETTTNIGEEAEAGQDEDIIDVPVTVFYGVDVADPQTSAVLKDTAYVSELVVFRNDTRTDITGSLTKIQYDRLSKEADTYMSAQGEDDEPPEDHSDEGYFGPRY